MTVLWPPKLEVGSVTFGGRGTVLTSTPVLTQPHIPLRVWTERPGEISWSCSCGTVNKHLQLSHVPAMLACAGQMETVRGELP